VAEIRVSNVDYKFAQSAIKYSLRVFVPSWQIFLKKSSISIEHVEKVWYNYNRHRNGSLAELRTSRAAAQVKNALFCIIKANVLNILVY
jgi:hypothetical protein